MSFLYKNTLISGIMRFMSAAGGYASTADGQTTVPVATPTPTPDVVNEIKDIVDTVKKYGDYPDISSILGKENTSETGQRLVEMAEKLKPLLRDFVYFLSGHYLIIGLIVVALSVGVAVFSRKNLAARKRAVFFAFFGPAICFILYIGGFIYTDYYIDGKIYKPVSDAYVQTIPTESRLDEAYHDLYTNTMDCYSSRGVKSDGVGFDFEGILGTLFVTISLVLAAGSFISGMIIQLVAVKDITTRAWARYGLCVVIPAVLIFGTLLYLGSFKAFFK